MTTQRDSYAAAMTKNIGQTMRAIDKAARGKVVGKYGAEGFLEGLVKNPFSSRESEDFTVKQIGDRALGSTLARLIRRESRTNKTLRKLRSASITCLLNGTSNDFRNVPKTFFGTFSVIEWRSAFFVIGFFKAS